MTATSKMLALLVTIGWLESIAAASFSNVVVQRNGVIPVEYINYDPSTLIFGNPRAAQLSTPVESDVQVPSVSAIVSPCLVPCIIPSPVGQSVTSLPSTSSAKIITYNPAATNLPVVVTNEEAPRGYQYAYAVYDDNTGDKKSQSEQSDGSVVQGQYTFIQPDGIRREVVYTADDLKGFNAVVRNILPELENAKEIKAEENPQQVPCPEPQNAQLTQNREQGSAKATSEVEHFEQPRSKPRSESKLEQKSVETSIEKILERAAKTSEEKVKNEKPHAEESHQSMEPTENSPPQFNDLISYSDVIKCLQANIISANSVGSPLTYILIPSLRGSC